VKIGKDDDVDKVSTDVTDSTIHELISQASPAHPNKKPHSRWDGEFTVYRVKGTLTVIKHEADDDDYHLVILDPDHAKETMIVESPLPSCATGSQFLEEIKKVRNAIDAHFGSITNKKLKPNIPVTVTGVAFFDPKHGQEGVAKNGIELHPILDIEFQ
jgi:hypothetical protein